MNGAQRPQREPLVRRRRLWAAGLGLALGLLVGAGFAIPHYLRLARAYSSKDVARLTGDLTIEEDREVGFVPARSGVSLRYHPKSGLRYHLFTSDRGARVSQPGAATPARVDLLTIGCSFSWGHGFENEETYTELLAKSTGMSVANLALASYGTTQSLLMLRRNLDLQPAIVVYGFMEDHLRRNLSACAPNYGPYCLPSPSIGRDEHGTPTILPPGPGFADNRRFYREFLYRDGIGPAKLYLLARADLLRLVRGPGREPSRPSREAALAYTVGEMHGAARSVGASLIVVFIPYLHQPTIKRPPAELIAAMRGLGSDTFLLDTSAAFRAYRQVPGRPSLALAGDLHPSPAAHAVIAAELERFIAEHRLRR